MGFLVDIKPKNYEINRSSDEERTSPNQDAQPFYNHLFFLLIANYAPLGKIYYNLFACISGFSFILLSDFEG